MGYKEYKKLWNQAQINGKYHMFVYDMKDSKNNTSRKTRSDALKLLFNVYDRLEEIENKEKRSILHRGKNIIEGSLKEKNEKGNIYYEYNYSKVLNEKIARGDNLEPFYLSGDLYGFTIERGTLTSYQIDKIWEQEREKLGIKVDFHKADGYYETDKYKDGNKLYYRGYCMQKLEEISKRKDKKNQIENER